MEKASEGKQAEAQAALTSSAKPMLDAKEKGEDAPMCFFTGKVEGGITERVRQLVKAGAASEALQVFMLDIPDNGGYYKADMPEVTPDSLTTVEAFKAKAL